MNKPYLTETEKQTDEINSNTKTVFWALYILIVAGFLGTVSHLNNLESEIKKEIRAARLESKSSASE